MGCGGLWAEAGNGSGPRERPEVSDVAGAGLAGGRAPTQERPIKSARHNAFEPVAACRGRRRQRGARL